jgi:hypothetical protein
MLINEIGDYEEKKNPKQILYQTIILKTHKKFISKSQCIFVVEINIVRANKNKLINEK